MVRIDHNVAIKNVIERRGIENLVHFTQLDNLQSIMTLGLLPTSELNLLRKKFSQNDLKRIDGREDCVSVSVEHPNVEYMQAIRRRNACRKWVVLEIDPACLYNQMNYFANHNAASNGVRMSAADRSTGQAFDMMFAKDVELVRYQGTKKLKRDLGMPASWPTSPQAEIQLRGSIPSSFIRAIYVENPVMEKEVEKIAGAAGVPTIVDPLMFVVRERRLRSQEKRYGI